MSGVNSALLPVATGAEVKAYVAALIRRQRRKTMGVLALYALAGMAGLAGPRLLGEIVGAVQHGTTRSHIDRIAVLLGAFVIAQAVLVRAARYASSVIAEGIFAELREEFLRKVVALPLSTVERAGTGDLLTRMTSDVDAMSRSVRFAMPETMIAMATAVLTLVAAFITAPLIALPCLIVVPLLWASTRWYLKRAPQGYLRERRVYSHMFAGMTEALEGARTIDALGLRDKRIRRGDDDVRRAFVAERYTLRLRTVWFPSTESAYVVPVVASLLVGGLLALHGHASLAQVTAVTLYFQQLVDPVDRLLGWLDEPRLARRRWLAWSVSGGYPPTVSRRARNPTASSCKPPMCRSPIALAATCCTASTSSSGRASGSRWSARAAPARARSAGCSPASTGHGQAA